MALNHKVGARADKDKLNWFGWTVHPTDELFDWTDLKRPAFTEKVKAIRAAYDAMATAGLLQELDILLDIDHVLGRREVHRFSGARE